MNKTTHLVLSILRLRYRSYPLSFDKLMQLRKRAGQEKDVLAVPLEKTRSSGKQLQNSYLASILAEDELGTWALDATVLNLLETKIRAKRPGAILEFGSGISTICFAWFMHEIHEDEDSLRVYSVEQSQSHLEKTRKRLIELGLDRIVKFIYAPLERQIIEGIQTECYKIFSPQHEPLFDRSPDFIVIDGPAAEDGARFGTLPLIKPFLKSGAVWYLDDALRDGELMAISQWTKLTYVKVHGVYLCGKGLATGYVYAA